MVKAWATDYRNMWAEGEIFIKYYTELTSRFSRVSFDTEKLNCKHREEFALLSFIPNKEEFSFIWIQLASSCQTFYKIHLLYMYCWMEYVQCKRSVALSSSSALRAFFHSRWGISSWGKSHGCISVWLLDYCNLDATLQSTVTPNSCIGRKIFEYIEYWPHMSMKCSELWWMSNGSQLGKVQITRVTQEESWHLVRRSFLLYLYACNGAL